MTRVILIPVAAFAIIASAVLLFASAQQDANAGVGSPSNVAIDMDPTGNTPTSIGSNEQCARINNNDTLDADEDVQADAVQADLTITGVTVEFPIAGFEATVAYDEGALTVQNSDTNQMLNSLPNSAVLPTSDPAPDTNENNVYIIGGLDSSGAKTAESGNGVLSRLTISADDGANAFQYVIAYARDGEGTPFVNMFDPNASVLPPDTVTEAWIAVDMECGATPPPPPTASPTPTPAPFAKGDIQCDDDVDAVDALTIQRHIAKLNTSQQPGCPPIGTTPGRVSGAGSAIFGDINCNDSVDAVDSLFILRFVAGLSVPIGGDCSPIGGQ